MRKKRSAVLNSSKKSLPSLAAPPNPPHLTPLYRDPLGCPNLSLSKKNESLRRSSQY